MIRGGALSILICLMGCTSQSAKKSNEEATRLAAAEKVRRFLETGDTLGLRVAFTDSVLTLLPMEQIGDLRLDLIERCGALVRVDGPFFDTTSAARLFIDFEVKDLDVWLEFGPDERISSVEIANAPYCDSTPGKPRVLSVDDAVTLKDISARRDLASKFNSDSDLVRLVSLLSPT